MSLKEEIKNEVSDLRKIYGVLLGHDHATRARMLRWLAEKNDSDTRKALKLEAEQRRLRLKFGRLKRKP